ncbi:MAG: hypothetical protein E6I91_12155 [Chloroflexi bacterium]|nr:MAG: hypothetical protein E6I91_12155 [Chloroflexota bacterium]
MRDLQRFHPAHAEFVICDYTIENRSHYVRDVSFQEDRSRLRTTHAPQLLAACRNLAITLLHRLGLSQISSARRSFSYHPEQALALLCSTGGQQ